MKRRWIIFPCILMCLLIPMSERQESAIPAEAAVEMADEPAYIALTFDDGPNRETTEKLLDGLRERDASATFFLVGERVAGNEDLILRMKEEGHQIGNHTWSHISLETADPVAFQEEVRRTEAVLEELLGDGQYWLRPPYGQIAQEELSLIRTPMVKWSVDPRDWESRNTDKVVKAALEAVEPGSIVLLHDIYPTSVEAALRIVDTLQAKGYEFVTVEELLYLNGIEAQAGVLYRSGKGSEY